VRRAKLYYLRDRVGKRARVRERRSIGPEEVIERELLHAPGAEEPEAAEAETLAPDAATEAPEAEAPAAETAVAPAAEAPAAEVPDTAAAASDSPDE
jgi:large subunit ribosomal protein L19